MHCRSARLVLCLGLLLTACPGALENPELFLPVDAGGACTVDDVEPIIFRNTCGGAGCHQAFDGASSNLDLIAPGVKARIRAQVSTCSGIPMASYILEKVKPTATCAGSRMPLAKPPLSAAQIACVSDWVAMVLDAGTGTGTVDAGSSDGGR